MPAYVNATENESGTLIANKKRFGTGAVGDDGTDVLTIGGLDIPMKAAKAMGYINEAEDVEYSLPGQTAANPASVARIDGVEVTWDSGGTVWDAAEEEDDFTGPTHWGA